MSKKVMFFCQNVCTIDEELDKIIKDLIEKLIIIEDADTFLFPSRMNDFEKLCYSVVAELNRKYLDIKKVKLLYGQIFDEEMLQDARFDDCEKINASHDAKLSLYNNLNYDLINFCDFFIFLDSNRLLEVNKKANLFVVQRVQVLLN